MHQKAGIPGRNEFILRKWLDEREITRDMMMKLKEACQAGRIVGKERSESCTRVGLQP